MKKNVKWIIIITGVLLVYSLINYLQIEQVLTIENLQENSDRLNQYIGHNYFHALALYVGLYILVIALNFPGGGIMTLAGGALFGVVPAMIMVNISATIGGTIGFIVARRFFGVFVQDKYGDRLDKFNQDIENYGKNYLLSLRLIPVFPFFFVNLAAGLTKVPLRTFVWTTSIGTIPGTFAYVFAGYNIGNIASGQPILSAPVLAALIILGVMSALPTVINRRKAKGHKD